MELKEKQSNFNKIASEFDALNKEVSKMEAKKESTEKNMKKE